MKFVVMGEAKEAFLTKLVNETGAKNKNRSGLTAIVAHPFLCQTVK